MRSKCELYLISPLFIAAGLIWYNMTVSINDVLRFNKLMCTDRQQDFEICRRKCIQGPKTGPFISSSITYRQLPIAFLLLKTHSVGGIWPHGVFYRQLKNDSTYQLSQQVDDSRLRWSRNVGAALHRWCFFFVIRYAFDIPIKNEVKKLLPKQLHDSLKHILVFWTPSLLILEFCRLFCKNINDTFEISGTTGQEGKALKKRVQKLNLSWNCPNN